ncbi:uncharacterized protein B0H18DRAFT_960551 [Fomitopsis serialis]|uniref:uncharacterized protein n=1 Tax=Fomitopsis serialis TaxID=139415 RepID=UPI002007396C|nr:uncharacterized protein B0H18DRAFT_960551 [Neoantrodia serialis]KAH9913186.1 hypothetical protein B0H18DRAFT_960551 [Neoantrodia serialis]
MHAMPRKRKDSQDSDYGYSQRIHVSHLRNVWLALKLAVFRDSMAARVKGLRLLRDALINYGAHEGLYTADNFWGTRSDKENVKDMVEDFAYSLARETQPEDISEWIEANWKNLRTPTNAFPLFPRRFEFDVKDIVKSSRQFHAEETDGLVSCMADSDVNPSDVADDPHVHKESIRGVSARKQNRLDKKQENAEHARNILRAGKKGGMKCEECKKRRKGCFFDDRSLSGYVSKQLSGNITSDRQPHAQADMQSPSLDGDVSTIQTGKTRSEREAKRNGKRHAHFGDEGPEQRLTMHTDEDRYSPVHRAEVCVPATDIALDLYRPMEELMLSYARGTDPAVGIASENGSAPSNHRQGGGMMPVEAMKVEEIQALVDERRKELALVRAEVFYQEQARDFAQREIMTREVDIERMEAQLKDLQSVHKTSDARHRGNNISSGSDREVDILILTIDGIMAKLSKSASEKEGDRISDTIQKWCDACTKDTMTTFQSAKVILSELRAALVELGLHIGVYSGKRPEPTWIVVELQKIVGFVSGRGSNRDVRKWLEAEWPELLGDRESCWPRLADVPGGNNIAETDDPMAGDDADREDHGDSGDDEEDTDEGSPPRPSQSGKPKRAAILAEESKAAIKVKADEYRKELKKLIRPEQCDYCRTATRAVRECIVDKGGVTCGTCRTAGKGCYFNGYSLNGTQSKKALTGTLQDNDDLAANSKGIERSTEVEVPIATGRQTRHSASSPGKLKPPPQPTRKRGRKAAEEDERDLATSTKPHASKPEKEGATASKDEHAEPTEDAPRRKRAKPEIAGLSSAGDGRTPLPFTSALTVSSAGQSAALSGVGATGSVRRVTDKQLSDFENLNIKDVEAASGRLDASSTSLVYGAVDDNTAAVRVVASFIKTLEQRQATVATSMETLTQEHAWLGANLAEYTQVLEDLQQGGMADAGGSRLPSSSQEPSQPDARVGGRAVSNTRRGR